MAGIIPFGTATASGNSYTVSALSTATTLSTGVTVLVKIPSRNTGPATLAIPGQSPGAYITYGDGAPIPPGGLAAGQLVLFNFDGAYWQIAETLVSAYVSVEQFGAVGNGLANDGPALALADAANSLVFTSGKTYLIQQDITFSSQAFFAPGAVLSVASPYVATFQLPPQAGAFQIFQVGGSSGSVVIHGIGLAEWFGAQGNGIADDSAAITRALNSCQGVTLLPRTYNIESNSISPNVPASGRLSLTGAGVDATTINITQHLNSSSNAIVINGFGASSNVYFEIGNFTINNSYFSNITSNADLPTLGNAVFVNNSANGYLHDLKILHCWGGIAFSSSEDAVVERVTLYGCFHHSLLLSDTPGATCPTPGVIGLSFYEIYTFGNYSIGSNNYVSTYGLLVTLSYDLYGVSFHEACEFYNCQLTEANQVLYITGPATSNYWRRGTSSMFKFTSCYFDTSTSYNYVNNLQNSQFFGCWIGATQGVADGIILALTDGLEFHGCQSMFNGGHGVHIQAATTNCRWIGGEVRNNSVGAAGSYTGILVENSVSHLVIQGVYVGDYPQQPAYVPPSPPCPPPTPAPFLISSPTQNYGIYLVPVNVSGTETFHGTNIVVMCNLALVQFVGTTSFGGIYVPPAYDSSSCFFQFNVS